MGTTNTTTGSNSSQLQFNPIAQGVYNTGQQAAGGVMNQYITNPFSNPAYNMGAAQSQKGAQQAGSNNMQALMQNMLTSGIGGQAGAGFKQAQMAQTGRANQAMSSQANVQNVLAALQRQMSASGTMLSYSPQLTGQSGNFSQSQSQSGLGTWLPQLLGAGMGAAMGGFGGGIGMGMNAAETAPAFAGGIGSGQSAFNLPNSAFPGFPSSVMQGAGGQMPSFGSTPPPYLGFGGGSPYNG